MKKVAKIIIICLVITTTLSTIFFLNKKEKVLETKSSTKSNFLSMMVEQEDGTYKENTNINLIKDGYLFNQEKSGCENGGSISWNEKYEKIEVSLLTSDKCYAYFDKDALGSICRGEKLAECFIKNYKKDENIIYHDGLSDYTGMKNYDLGAEDLSYRYSGSSEEVKNYVCFGSDDETCPPNNLYRIIGFFKNNDTAVYETKLIKADYANKDLLGSGETKPNGTVDYENNGSFFSGVSSKTSENAEEKDAFIHRYRGSLTEVNKYYYQEKGTNETKADWPNALLNTIHLNHNFLEKFDKTWQDKIIAYKWHYKGDTWANIAIGNKKSSNTIRTTYDYEVGSKADTTLTEPTKIGLMYVSDYLYGASPNNWDKKPFNGTYSYIPGDPDSEENPQGTYGGTDGTDYRSAVDENWMYMGLWEWTVTQRTDDSGIRAFCLYAPGRVYSLPVGAIPYVIRPTFYITTMIKLKSGNGTKEKPYLFAI